MDNNQYEAIKSVAWDAEAPDGRPPVPFHVLVGEGIDLVRFCQRNWEPRKSGGDIAIPGLRSAVGNGSFHEGVAEELMSLVEALQKAQTDYRLVVDQRRGAPSERAHFVLTEIRATLQWCFDDGEDDDNDARLTSLLDTHEDAASHDAIAAALYDFAELAERVKERLDGLGGFEPKLIDEARELANALREVSAGPSAYPNEEDEALALDLKNRFLELVYRKSQQIRAAARFVFRRHPKLIREVSSAYARRSRAARRQRTQESDIQELSVPESQAKTEVQAS